MHDSQSTGLWAGLPLFKEDDRNDRKRWQDERVVDVQQRMHRARVNAVRTYSVRIKAVSFREGRVDVETTSVVS